MSNHTEKFLSKYHMSEAKRAEAVLNSYRKRTGSQHPIGSIVAWSCGCCIGPTEKHWLKLATPEEAEAILKQRKHDDKCAKTSKSTQHPVNGL